MQWYRSQFSLCHDCNERQQLHPLTLLSIHFTFHEVENVLTDDKKSGQRRGLMVWPEIVFNFIIEKLVIILTHADINDQEVTIMDFLEVLRNIVNRVPVSLLKAGCRICHCNYSFSNIGQIELGAFPGCSVFRACYNFTDEADHYFV